MNIIRSVHIADLHFGCINPFDELDILTKQFLNPVMGMRPDFISICGDIFDRKFPANHPAISCAISFVDQCATICKTWGASLIILGGTESHDAGQLSVFKYLENTPGLEVYIVDSIRFVYTHGIKILCIPEEYGKGAAYYENYLQHPYDMVLMHGTVVGSTPKATQENLGSNREPVFSIDNFSMCKGPIICGHIHVNMVLDKDITYISSPIRWRFREEGEKGYLVNLYDIHTRQYTNYLYPIKSYTYDTVDINDLGTTDANEIITKLDYMLANGSDCVRLVCKGLPEYQVALLKKYYHESKDDRVKLKVDGGSANGDIISIDDITDSGKSILGDKAFLLDSRIDDYTKLVMYINMSEGSDLISVNELKRLLGT